jgi:hypothetical protein
MIYLINKLDDAIIAEIHILNPELVMVNSLESAVIAV